MAVIQKVEVFQNPLELKKPFVISLEKFTHANNLVVVIHDNEGRIGYGECSPFPTINGETMKAGYTIASQFAYSIIGFEVLDFKVAMSNLESKIFGNFSVKSAFDIALHDLAAQVRNIPLYEFWGPPQWTVLATDYTVSLGTADEMAAAAQAIKTAGYPAIKVKIGGKPEADLQRLRAIRAVVGDDIPLRLDANQGWDFAGALQVLTALNGWNIEFCEAPISRRLYHRLPELRKQVPVPIMADESCFDHYDAQRLLGAGACDYLNIKLGKAGGLTEARKILKVAESFSAKVQIGGFLESRLGFTAAAHLALSSPAVQFIDMDTPLMMKDDPVEGGIKYKANGVVELPTGNGLGASYRPGTAAL